MLVRPGERAVMCCDNRCCDDRKSEQAAVPQPAGWAVAATGAALATEALV